jgi:hypothetical protein
MFVHMAPAKNVDASRRAGINRLRKPAAGPGGLFAMPVTRNFYVSHQWVREMRRRGQGPMAGVYFRIPDREPVWVGHYNQNHQEMTAAEAVALMMSAENVEGFEVIVPRKIRKDEIHRVRRLPQITGWRYYPGSHGKVPCGCPFCQRGLYGARKLRAAYEADDRAATALEK